MTGLESITQRIIDEANQKAENIINSAKAQATEIEKKSNDDIKARQEKTHEDAKKNAEIRAQRIVASAHLEGKKEYLAAKQAIIDDVFTKATATLASLGDSEYDALIKDMSSGVSGEITMLPRDKENGTGGGFIAKNGKVEYNFAFDALAKNAKERLEKDLITILFD